MHFNPLDGLKEKYGEEIVNAAYDELNEKYRFVEFSHAIIMLDNVLAFRYDKKFEPKQGIVERYNEIKRIMKRKNKIDLRNCKRGDILISSHGAKLEYISPTPWKYYEYLDHVVKYIEDEHGKPYEEEMYGTRTHDGFVFKKNRMPEIDHDIVKIIKK